MVFFQPLMNWRRRAPRGDAARAPNSSYELILPAPRPCDRSLHQFHHRVTSLNHLSPLHPNTVLVADVRPFSLQYNRTLPMTYWIVQFEYQIGCSVTEASFHSSLERDARRGACVLRCGANGTERWQVKLSLSRRRAESYDRRPLRGCLMHISSRESCATHWLHNSLFASLHGKSRAGRGPWRLSYQLTHANIKCNSSVLAFWSLAARGLVLREQLAASDQSLDLI